jgi:hypothetical protein
MLLLDYSSLFMIISFAGGGVGSVGPGAALDYFPGMGWGFGVCRGAARGA